MDTNELSRIAESTGFTVHSVARGLYDTQRKAFTSSFGFFKAIMERVPQAEPAVHGSFGHLLYFQKGAQIIAPMRCEIRPGDIFFFEGAKFKKEGMFGGSKYLGITEHGTLAIVDVVEGRGTYRLLGFDHSKSSDSVQKINVHLDEMCDGKLEVCLNHYINFSRHAHKR